MIDTVTQITNLPLGTLKTQLAEWEEPAFRYNQIIQWLYKKRVDSFDSMHNVAKSTRKKLADKYTVEKLPVRYLLESEKGDAVKFGFGAGTEDAVIETVLLYDGKRRSLCVSSQLGCSLDCRFCETATMGLIRNLTLHEITGQVIGANDYLAAHDDRPVTNIIFMGMGEALANFNTFLDALEIIMHKDCFAIGGRKITVSTAGLIPAVRKLMALDLNINLAISLNAPTDDLRNRLMPINRKYPIKTVIDAAKEYYKKKGAVVTFEYILIAGENDSDKAADALSKLLRGVPCKVNLIQLNPCTNGSMHAPTRQRLETFMGKLAAHRIAVTVRKSRGRDISGACGQLAGKHNRKI